MCNQNCCREEEALSNANRCKFCLKIKDQENNFLLQFLKILKLIGADSCKVFGALLKTRRIINMLVNYNKNTTQDFEAKRSNLLSFAFLTKLQDDPKAKFDKSPTPR